MKTLKFNEQMVQAIKEGRKTQTRRALWMQPPEGMGYYGLSGTVAMFIFDGAELKVFFPYDHNAKYAKVKGYRCERLQDIRDEDCLKEGIVRLSKDGGQTYKYGIPDKDGLPGNDDFGWPWRNWENTPKEAFEKLWRSIYPSGPKSWDAAPWVWVIDFEVVK